MSLVNELQEVAERDDILTVLRKAKRVAGKLNRTDISEWIEKEMSGYGPDDELPNYRKVELCLAYNSNGYIPAGYGYLKNGVEPLHTFPSITENIRFSIGPLANMAEGQIMAFPCTPNQEQIVKSRLRCDMPQILDQISIHTYMSETQRTGIIDAVRDRVLDWAIELERKGITGKGSTFSEKEKDMAANNIINNLGTLNATIQSDGASTSMQVGVPAKNTFWQHFCSWYGILGTTATIGFGMLGWYGLHIQYNWWFFNIGK